MARITSELAVQQVSNRYDMILIGARRAREISNGWQSQVNKPGGPVVTALREIEAGIIGRDYLQKPQNLSRKEQSTPKNNRVK